MTVLGAWLGVIWGGNSPKRRAARLVVLHLRDCRLHHGDLGGLERIREHYTGQALVRDDEKGAVFRDHHPGAWAGREFLVHPA